MTGPVLINREIEVHGHPPVFGGQSLYTTLDHPCEGAAFHSPRPLLTTRYIRDSVDVYLCLTCRSNLETLLHLAYVLDGDGLDHWQLWRESGNKIRALMKAVLAAPKVSVTV